MFEYELNLQKLCIWDLDVDSLRLLASKTKNVFWKNVITYWSEYKICHAGEIDERTYPIWGSSFIKNYNILKR